MLNASPRRLLRLAFATAFAAAFTVVSIVATSAYQRPAPEANTELIAYLQTGGNLSDICINGTDPAAANRLCDICNLVNFTLAPNNNGTCEIVRTEGAVSDGFLLPELHADLRLDLSRAIRAPPQI